MRSLTQLNRHSRETHTHRACVFIEETHSALFQEIPPKQVAYACAATLFRFNVLRICDVMAFRAL